MEEKNKLVKMSFVKGLTYSFNSILDNFMGFMFFSLICSLFSSVLKTIFDGTNNILFYLSFIVLFLLNVSFFINCWFSILLGDNKIKGILKSFSVKKLFRTLLFVFLNIFTWSIIIGASAFLYKRVAELNIWLEIFIYLGLSFIIILCFLFLLNFVVFICFLKKEKWLVFHKNFWAIYDNVNKIMGWIFVLFIMFFVLSYELSSVFVMPDFLTVTLKMWVFYFCLAFYVSNLNYQYEEIFINKS